MDFEDALQRTAPIERVGSLRLRYETSLLIAEPDPPRTDFRLHLVRLSGASLLALAFASVVSSTAGRPPPAAFVLLILGVGLLTAAARLFRTAPRRRFVLNFASESLRIDDVGAAPRTRILHFDDVASLTVEPEPNGLFALVLTAKQPPSEEVLLRGVSPDDVEQLRRLWRILTDALGIRRPGVDL